MSEDWQVGDRVQLWLPDRGRRNDVLMAGTVVAVDPEGLPRGVKVALDEKVNGVMDCYATHRELAPEPRSLPAGRGESAALMSTEEP